MRYCYSITIPSFILLSDILCPSCTPCNLSTPHHSNTWTPFLNQFHHLLALSNILPPPLHQKNSVDCKCVHTLVCCIKEHGITHIIHSMYIPHTKSKSSKKKLSTTLVDKRHNISFPILSSSSSQSIPTIHYSSITPTSITISSITKFIPLTTQFFPPFLLGSFDTFTFPFHL